MSASSASEAALLWDESFLWGIMAFRALKASGIPFDVITAEEIRQGRLRDCRLLFVPGGWASNKLKALREEGAQEIRRFVSEGGSYLGFCGGAGLATQDGLGLVSVKRMPTKQRVPSFSGRINLNLNDHPLWNGLPGQASQSPEDPGSRVQDPVVGAYGHTPLQHASPPFHAWWPSQFLIDDPAVRILATYGDPLPDAFSSDLNVGDMEKTTGWESLEEKYRINLDPKRLRGEPAVIEARYGKGTVIASLIHFDTPEDMNGGIVLRNLWEYLLGEKAEGRRQKAEERTQSSEGWRSSVEAGIIAEMQEAVSGLIGLGQRNFLWFWRNSMLLQWRRGVRGLEYCTLYGMVRELSAAGKGSVALDINRLEVLRDRMLPFIEKAKSLLVRERFALQESPITYERCDDQEIQAMRTELFSTSKSYGGAFKAILDELDAIILPLIREGVSCR